MNEAFMSTNNDRILKAMQEIELEILKEFDRICRKYDINYSLGGGSNLGQVRHGGFIPWDDDIDIDMTVENYNKFMDVALEELDEDKYFLRCRKTDKLHLRSASRLERKGTQIGKGVWDKRDEHVGVFIDIFRWSYLPNNPLLRKLVTSLLFFLRGVENRKEFGAIPAKMKQWAHFPVLFFAFILPRKLVIKIDDTLCNCCRGKHTNWIIDDAIINGNHGGYYAEGIDEYMDVEFDGIQTMIKKNSHNFLKTIYGDHYNEWLPPVKRISHHTWTTVDFGKYALKYNLPENYYEYISINYNRRKLERMQEVTDMMIRDIDLICKKHHIEYYPVKNVITLSDEYEKKFHGLWERPGKIAMLREDYNRFSEICQYEFGKKYFFQTSETDPQYRYEGARVRLNHTYIKDRKIPLNIEREINSGFYVSIAPLENTSDDINKQQKHLKSIRRRCGLCSVRWRKHRPLAFHNGKIKTKIKILFTLPFSNCTMTKWARKSINRYNTCDSEYCVDGTGSLKWMVIKKSILREKKEIVVNYGDDIPENIDKFCEEIKRKHNRCHLTYFEDSDYQLSALRYDEKNGKILSNKEVLGYE